MADIPQDKTTADGDPWRAVLDGLMMHLRSRIASRRAQAGKLETHTERARWERADELEMLQADLGALIAETEARLAR